MGGSSHVHTYTQRSCAGEGGWSWCCLQVIYGLRSCCPTGWPGGKEAQPGPDPVGKCDSAVLLLKLPGVWPVTGAAGALSVSPSVNNGFIRFPGKTPGVGGSSTLGEGGWDPWGDSHSWKKMQKGLPLHHSTAGKMNPLWGDWATATKQLTAPNP